MFSYVYTLMGSIIKKFDKTGKVIIVNNLIVFALIYSRQ
jgi:hypothetical protein